MMKKRISIILTGLLCLTLLFGAGLKTAQLRTFAAEAIAAAEEEDPDAGYGDLPEPPSASDAKKDVEAILSEAEQEKETLRESTNISGKRHGLAIAGMIVIGIGAVAVYYFKFNKYND